MTTIEFCPYCDSPAHKLMNINEDIKYCKVCQKFFSIKQINLKCPKCDYHIISHSDFPMPTGEAIFQCHKCKKMFGAKEMIGYNHL
ncbi:MAG: hypothetical protein ABIG95_06580 [Candidatus Woesearchaeota archaeon]